MSPRVGASMADVSTEFVPVNPDVYTAKIEKVDFKDQGGRHTFVVKNKIIAGSETAEEFAGKTVNDRISMHLKDGGENEFGAIQLKRYVEAVYPESKEWTREEWDEFDTDSLVGHLVQISVKIESFTDEKTKETRKNNKVERVLAAA